MKWTLKKFSDLSTDEFHDILKLRINTFVVEQNCPYPELDGKDRMAYHYFGETDSGRIVAYTRIFGPGDCYAEPAVGRVVVDPEFRRDGLGYELMRGSILCIEELYGSCDIKIGAQKYLTGFYQSLGFIEVGEEYLEDGIPHVHMIRYTGN